MFFYNIVPCVVKNARVLFVQLYLRLLFLGNDCGKCFDSSEMPRAKVHYRAQSRAFVTILKFVKIMTSMDYRG